MGHWPIQKFKSSYKRLSFQSVKITDKEMYFNIGTKSNNTYIFIYKNVYN